MSGGEHEAIAIEPVRVVRIVAQVSRPDRVAPSAAAPSGKPGCPEFAFWTASIEQHANRVDALFVYSRVRHTSPMRRRAPERARFAVGFRTRSSRPGRPSAPAGDASARAYPLLGWMSATSRPHRGAGARFRRGCTAQTARAVDEVIAALDEGRLRVAEPERRRAGSPRLGQAGDLACTSRGWTAWRSASAGCGRGRRCAASPPSYFDKLPTKRNYKKLGVRCVPGGVARYGSYPRPRTRS